MRAAILTLAMLVAGLAGLASPVSAAESIVYSAFKQTCGVDDSANALATADQLNWAPLPEAMISKSFGSVPGSNLKEGGARAAVVDRRLVMMLAGRADFSQDDPKMEASLCAVVSFSTEAGQLLRDLRAVTGVAPTPVPGEETKGLNMWAYMDGPKGREFFPDIQTSKAMRAMLDGKLVMLMAGEEQGMTMIVRLRPVMAE